jgi:hypothetical protein
MAYVDQATLADDVTFRARIRVAIMTAAVQVQGEAKSGFSDAQYGKRQALATAILATGGSDYIDRFSWAVATNVAVTAASTDSDIQFTVNSMWDDLAGVTENDA